MDCRQSQEALVETSDGSLSGPNAEAVRAHASDCPTCARRLAEVEAVGRALKSLPRISAPDDLWPRVRRAIAADRRRRARMRRLVPAVAPFAAAALLVLGIFLRTPEREPVPRKPIPDPSVAVATNGLLEARMVEAIILEHTQLANEPFVGGDDLLVAECAFPADVIRTSDQP